MNTDNINEPYLKITLKQGHEISKANRKKLMTELYKLKNEKSVCDEIIENIYEENEMDKLTDLLIKSSYFGIADDLTDMYNNKLNIDKNKVSNCELPVSIVKTQTQILNKLKNITQILNRLEKEIENYESQQ